MLEVERSLLILPITQEHDGALEPDEITPNALMKRLRHELDRSGQTVPTVPAEPPALTEGARIRADATARVMQRFNAAAEAAPDQP